MSAAMYTSPDPLSPSGLAPLRLVLLGDNSFGFVSDPGPPRSIAQPKRPPRHFLISKFSFLLQRLRAII